MPEECEKQCIVVTYDSEIAKMDYQSQSEEKPKFGSIFIALGAFHLEMALFMLTFNLLQNLVDLIY